VFEHCLAARAAGDMLGDGTLFRVIKLLVEQAFQQFGREARGHRLRAMFTTFCLDEREA
jgi:hypothetical protein